MNIVRNERQRYILFKVLKEKEADFEQQEVIKAIWQSIWRYFGLKEANKMGLWLIEFNLEAGYGIIRSSHQTKEILISSLTLVNEISGEKVILSPIKTSGTIKSIKRTQELMSI